MLHYPLMMSLFLLLRRAGDPSENQHCLGVIRENSEWGRKTTKGVLPEDVEIWTMVWVFITAGVLTLWTSV